MNDRTDEAADTTAKAMASLKLVEDPYWIRHLRLLRKIHKMPPEIRNQIEGLMLPSNGINFVAVGRYDAAILPPLHSAPVWEDAMTCIGMELVEDPARDGPRDVEDPKKDETPNFPPYLQSGFVRVMNAVKGSGLAKLQREKSFGPNDMLKRSYYTKSGQKLDLNVKDELFYCNEASEVRVKAEGEDDDDTEGASDAAQAGALATELNKPTDGCLAEGELSPFSDTLTSIEALEILDDLSYRCFACGKHFHLHDIRLHERLRQYARFLQRFPDLESVYLVFPLEKTAENFASGPQEPRYVATGAARFADPQGRRWVQAKGEKFQVWDPNYTLWEVSGGHNHPVSTRFTRIVDVLQYDVVHMEAEHRPLTKNKAKEVVFKMMAWGDFGYV